jgi:hypothetical protein
MSDETLRVRAAIQEIMNNRKHAYWNPGDPLHKDAVRLMVELHSLADPAAPKVIEAAGNVAGAPTAYALAPPPPPPVDLGDEAAARARVAGVVERLRAAGQNARADALAAALVVDPETK